MTLRALLMPWAAGEFDLFIFFRWWLSLVCLIYAGILSIRSLLGWIDYLGQPDRARTMLRHYVIVQLLRLRVRRFRAELLRIAAWSMVLMLLIRAHAWVG